VETVRKPGRPRSEAVRAAILDAAIEELRDRGYAALTVEGIAARAGAGKQTIYRWWQSKADVVLDAMLELAAARIKVPDKGSLAADLGAFLADTFRQRDLRPVVAGLMAQAQFDPVFAESFRERFIFARRAALRPVLQTARNRGELAPDVDIELVLDVVFGVLWYRLLVDHAPLDAKAARQLTELILRAVRPA
jgi:AcrR family transcriptional regulator